MSKHTSSLLIDEQPLQVIPSLAVKLGLNRAMFVQQLHYWLQKKSAHVRDDRRWIYNTFEEWHEQFPFWSAEAIRKIVAQLEARGIIETTDRYNPRRADRTKWYTIDYDALDMLLEPPEEGPEKSTQTLNPPDKSTEGPDKSTELHPDKSTERYQRLPETTDRDSVFQTGDHPEDGDGSPTEEEKTQDQKQYAVAQLMERVTAARSRGVSIHSPTNDERKQFGRMFAQASKDGHEIPELLLALDYQVAKASGEIEGEPKAWCGFRTALDRVDEGWRPPGATRASPDDEEHWRQVEENDRMLAELTKDMSF